MRSAPLLSVCIPAYNRAAVLDELLQSVLSQDFGDFEIVVCEDASPEREAIRAIIEALPRAMRTRIRYFAVTEFLAARPPFEPDAAGERLLPTHNPRGWLRRNK